MNKNQNILRTAIAITALLHFVLYNSDPLWVGLFDGLWVASVALLMFILRVWLAVAAVLMIVRLAKYAAWRRLSNYLFAGIATAYLLLLWLVPRPLIDAGAFRGRVMITACREGTNSHSTITFRENGTFGRTDASFFRTSHYRGTYTQKGDTLFLHFTKGDPGISGDTLVMRDSVMYRVQADTAVHAYYHVGACPGLN